MNPSTWPIWLNDVWAKSPDGNQASGESLAQHTWQALQRLRDFVALRPDLPARVGNPRLWQVLFWAVFLHDFGKAATGFQSRLRGGPRWPHRHEVFSLAFVDWLADGINEDERLWLVAAIVSHHKDARDIQSLYEPPEEEEDWKNDQVALCLEEFDDEVLRGLWRWISECAAGWIEELGFGTWGVTVPGVLSEEDGLTAFRKHGAERVYAHLAAYRRFLRTIQRNRDQETVIGTLTLRGYMIVSDHSASAHAGSPSRPALDAAAILAKCKLSHNNLFAHQKEASRTNGSALLTAPTGSGKTEAALLWAACQKASDSSVARLFYTLPYQASMNAMKLRLDGVFREQDCVGLQHGRSLLSMYRLLMDSDPAPEAAAQQAAWSRKLARLNYQPIRVFSPYQMLKGMYRLKGYEALLTDYHDALFIFDEIHAYEVTRLAMILKTIEFLAQNYRARFFIMSATFPSLIKEWISESLGDYTEISAEASLSEQFCRHQLHLLDGDLLSDRNLERIAADARMGRSVLVVCNTVKRAQRAYHELGARLEQTNVPVELLHGRFNMRDRSTKERWVRQYTGPEEETRRPVLLVSTQVVEVSLDIDLDTIYTDPAPMEALVQRFGRVNRRRKMKLSPVHVFREPEDGQGIYDETLVKTTLSVLSREDGKPVDEAAIGQWLDQEIYAGEVAQRWRTEYAHAANNFEAACVRTMRAFDADETLEDVFYQAFDGTEVLPVSLQREYDVIVETQPILAAELTVPISYRRLRQIRQEDRVASSPGEWPIIVDIPYDGCLGLEFDVLTKR